MREKNFETRVKKGVFGFLIFYKPQILIQEIRQLMEEKVAMEFPKV